MHIQPLASPIYAYGTLGRVQVSINTYLSVSVCASQNGPFIRAVCESGGYDRGLSLVSSLFDIDDSGTTPDTTALLEPACTEYQNGSQCNLVPVTTQRCDIETNGRMIVSCWMSTLIPDGELFLLLCFFIFIFMCMLSK